MKRPQHRSMSKGPLFAFSAFTVAKRGWNLPPTPPHTNTLTFFFVDAAISTTERGVPLGDCVAVLWYFYLSKFLMFLSLYFYILIFIDECNMDVLYQCHRRCRVISMTIRQVANNVNAFQQFLKCFKL